MTTKKSTTTKLADKDESAEDITRGGLYNAKGDDHNPLTDDTVRELLLKLHGALTVHGEPEPCEDFLLLLYSIAHEPDKSRLWTIYDNARDIFATRVSGVDDAIDDALAGALGRLKGGAQ